MIMERKKLYLLLAVVVMVCTVVSCNPGDGRNGVTDTAANAVVVESELPSDGEMGPLFDGKTEAVQTAEPEVVEEPAQVSKPAPVAKKKKPEPKPKTETIYVSTYDRGGQVWGHITMTGDRGKGTIHDADENHYSVTCTRHGNELFAVDQNSRQYVFKLKE